MFSGALVRVVVLIDDEPNGVLVVAGYVLGGACAWIESKTSWGVRKPKHFRGI